MNTRFLLPVFNDNGERKVHLEKLAGIPLIRRLVLISRRVGLYCTIITLSDQDNSAIRSALAGTSAGIISADELSDDGSEFPNLLLILTTGFLPEAGFFERVLRGDFREGMMVDQNDFPVAWLGRRPEEFASIMERALHTGHLIEILAQDKNGTKVVVPESLGVVLRSIEEHTAAEERLLSTLIKDTEGFVSRHINRKISLAFTRRLMTTAITPNQMTLISTLIGLAGAVLFLSDSYYAQLTGAFLFLSHSILDGCDGELARLKLMESRLGGVLDFWGDNTVHVAVFACMGIGWSMSAHSTGPLLLGGMAVAGTVVSAWIVFAHTMQNPAKSGPQYTSVSTTEPSAMSRFADMLSRRDFIYLVVLLALAGKTHWFLVITAIGAPLYAVILVIILFLDNLKKRKGSPRGD